MTSEAGQETQNGKQRKNRATLSIAEAYHLLGLSPGTSIEVVQARYRRLALKYHPDRNADNPESLEHFKQLSAAYRLLRQKFRLDRDESKGMRGECDHCGEYTVLHTSLDGSHACSACLSLAHRRPLLPAPPLVIVTCATTITLLVLAFGFLGLGLASGDRSYSALAFGLGLLSLGSLFVTCLTVVYTATPSRRLRRRSPQRGRIRPTAASSAKPPA